MDFMGKYFLAFYGLFINVQTVGNLASEAKELNAMHGTVHESFPYELILDV